MEFWRQNAYICAVKTFERQEDVAIVAAYFYALKQEKNTSVTAWASGNTPKAIAQKCLTARSADFFLVKTLLSYEKSKTNP